MYVHGKDYLLANQNFILQFNALHRIICYCPFEAIAANSIRYNYIDIFSLCSKQCFT